jgi:osmotically-inducible protein OsmY
MIAPNSSPVTILVLLLSATLAGCTPELACSTADCSGDGKISAAVKTQLNKENALKIDNIRVQTINHVVYLSGQVDTQRERFDAMSIAAHVAGVAKVVDNLGVSGRGG